ncbi:MAG: hypothetical protein JSR21_12150 [Proteobacteria bacterium]|nr:hypothetical protein [Pseudomonadota bacterium]
MTATLALFEDILPDGAALALPARPRMVFVVHGGISVDDAKTAEGAAWHGQQATTLRAGPHGAALWRWDLTQGETAPPPAAPGVRSTLKLAAALETLPAGDLLLRGDSVAFPPGGCAFRHTHQGPGIRCLIEGGIRIDTHGRSTSYGPGGAWYEAGPEPVFAQAAADRPSRFIRVMVLPRALLGQSSIRYVDPADRDKPKSQTYRIFVDAPIG